MASISNRIKENKIIAMIHGEDREKAEKAAEACIEGGVRILEISQRIQGAREIIQALSAREDLLVGAGMILNTRMAEIAIESQAGFLYTPNSDQEVIRLGKNRDRFVMGGAFTPTEIVRAWQLGADMVRVFPASCAGGPEYIEFIRKTFPFVEIIPTCGISLEDVSGYLKAGAAALGVEEALASLSLIEEGAWEEIVGRARDLTSRVQPAT